MSDAKALCHYAEASAIKLQLEKIRAKLIDELKNLVETMEIKVNEGAKRKDRKDELAEMKKDLKMATDLQFHALKFWRESQQASLAEKLK